MTHCQSFGSKARVEENNRQRGEKHLNCAHEESFCHINEGMNHLKKTYQCKIQMKDLSDGYRKIKNQKKKNSLKLSAHLIMIEKLKITNQ